MSKLPEIKVSENNRFLVSAENRPFFWLGDTAWELFHRLTREEAETYLETRSRQGFNVIQAVILAEIDGLNSPNANGHKPLIENDPTQPDENYFQHVDTILRIAEEKGLYIGLLPTWGDKVNLAWGKGPTIFTQENAFVYGRYLGKRYQHASNIIWILGGDRETKGYEQIWRSMVNGIETGLGRHPLMTFHPMGRHSSAESFHEDTWLDFNMIQSGHGQRNAPTWEMIAHDYALIPAKPILDGEPNYEDHPLNWKQETGYLDAYDVRKQVYRSVFAGGFGVTYGHQSIWQFYTEGHSPIAHPRYRWQGALHRPGAYQMMHLRNLMLSRPFLTRIPDQDILAYIEGDGKESSQHLQATRCSEGSYAFISIPNAHQNAIIHMNKIAGKSSIAWWYDPRTGGAEIIGEFNNSGTQVFITPDSGPDWILVLDEKTRKFPVPGRSIE